MSVVPFSPEDGRGLTSQAFELAARPHGVSVAELTAQGFGRMSANTILTRLVKQGRLHRARTAWLPWRFFHTLAAASAWLRVAQATAAPVPMVAAAPSTLEGWMGRCTGHAGGGGVGGDAQVPASTPRPVPRREDAPVVAAIRADDMPPSVPTTRAPPLIDRRYHVELPPEGGPLMAEWRRLRGQGAAM